MQLNFRPYDKKHTSLFLEKEQLVVRHNNSNIFSPRAKANEAIDKLRKIKDLKSIGLFKLFGCGLDYAEIIVTL